MAALLAGSCRGNVDLASAGATTDPASGSVPVVAATIPATGSATPAPTATPIGLVDFDSGDQPGPTPTPGLTPLPGKLRVVPSLTLCRPSAGSCPSTGSVEAFVGESTESADAWDIITDDGRPVYGATIDPDGFVSISDDIRIPDDVGQVSYNIRARKANDWASAWLTVKK